MSRTRARGRSRGAVLAVLVTVALVVGTLTATTVSAAPAADFTAVGSARQVYVTGLAPSTQVSLLKSGVVWVNTYNQFDAAAPFGGYRQSGYGREMGHAVLDGYTQIKTAWINLR